LLFKPYGGNIQNREKPPFTSRHLEED